MWLTGKELLACLYPWPPNQRMDFSQQDLSLQFVGYLFYLMQMEGEFVRIKFVEV